MNQLNLDIGDSPPADSALPQQATILKPPSDAAQAVTLVSGATGGAPAVSGLTTLAGFELLGELGRGGMGVVYKARQISLNRLVALKMILAGAHAGAQDLARFRNEAEAVARLQHPNIVQIHEVGEAEGRPFFALELVEGGSLADKLDGTPQPARESAQLVETLARAIHAAHQQGIVHRDLKPANILLQMADGRLQIDKEEQSAILNLQSAIPKITDFGLAKRLDGAAGQTQTGSVMGTPSYMAPEQAGGRKQEIGAATDVYALGAILYELLTGRPPFKAATPLDTVLQVLSDEPVPLSQLQSKVPRDLETICLHCLNKDPRKRYASAADLAEDLHRFLSGEPILARPIRIWERGLKWARRRPASAGLIGVSALALLTLLTVGLIYHAQLELSHLQLETALTNLKKERDAVVNAREETQRQQARAESHLHTALDAVERMLTRVSSERLAEVPQIGDLRKQLLEEALVFYRGFLKQEGDDPFVRQETAQAYYRSADLHLLLADSKQAEKDCLEALQLQQKLVADFPDRLEYLFDLSQSYRLQGHMQLMAGLSGLCVQSYGRAQALLDQLLQREPSNARFQESLAQTYLYLGYAALLTDFRQATSQFLKSVSIAEQLVHDHPGGLNYQCLLGGGATNLGVSLLIVGRIKDAEAALQRGEALLQSQGKPGIQTERDYAHFLAMNQIYRGLLSLRTNHRAVAETQLRDGLAGLEQLLKIYPKHFGVRMQLARNYPTLAEIYDQNKRPELAEASLKRAMEIADELMRDFPSFGWMAGLFQQARINQMVLAARKGEIEPFLAQAKDLAGKNISPELTYNLACFYALAAAATPADARLREEYSLQAIRLLNGSLNKGFFRDTYALTNARTDDDLKFMRGRPEFQQILQKAEEKLKSRPKAGERGKSGS